MALRVQIVAILVTAGLFTLVFELVRRRRLMERYALVWLGASSILLVLAIWKGLLNEIAHAIGIYYAPSALFVIAFGFILVLLLNFSLVISRLADQNKVLAQRIGMLQQRLEAQERAGAATAAAPAAVDGEERAAAERELTRTR
jgi:hypothetical protein